MSFINSYLESIMDNFQKKDKIQKEGGLDA